jgi:hypothetical protein
MEKTYRYQQNVGKARHVISFHDGVKTHKDGSPFFDLKICSRKPDALRFIRELEAEGFKAA